MPILTRWGHSCGLRIPAHVLQCAGLKVGDFVTVRALVAGGDILIRSVNPMPQTSIVSAEEGALKVPARITEDKW